MQNVTASAQFMPRYSISQPEYCDGDVRLAGCESHKAALNFSRVQLVILFGFRKRFVILKIRRFQSSE